MEQALEVGICVCGPVLTGIEATLKDRWGLRVRRLGDSLAAAVWEIKMLSPDVVLFEMGGAEEAVIAALLREHPGIRLIGVEPERDLFTVFSASEQPVLSGEELLRVIEGDHARLMSQPKGERHHAQR